MPALYLDKAAACEHISKEARAKVIEYLSWDPRPETQKETAELLEKAASPDVAKQIENRFLKRLEFGTAGLRGAMGCGFNCMNDLTVIQASQGVATYFLQQYGSEECARRGVVLGFDGRHNSQRYAHATAAVFLSKGFKVYLNSKVTATPMNPYAVVLYGVGGIQVTASHNPKNDNGYKLYAANGAQIIPPMDSDIAALILANLKPWDEAMALLDATTGMLRDVLKVTDPYDAIFASYMDNLTKELLLNKEAIAQSDLKIVYTAMHGVGYPFVKEILERFGYTKNLHVVEQQKLPDPEFSTVSFSNPEEKGALDLAMALADKAGSPMVIANDPDADRFACAEKQADGKWKIFHGDELGILFGARMFDLAVSKGIPREKMVFICSAVSSRMLQKMAETEGCVFEETMTGFKWIMNKALDMKAQGYTPCFAYEEALGYGVSMQVPDKDGVSAAAVWVEMACELYKKGMTIGDRLDQLRKRYGYFVTNNSYFLCYEKSAIEALFAEFRNNGKYTPALGDFKIKRIRDATTGYDNGQKDNKCAFPLTPSSQMVTLFFENGAVLTLRTSGTEPKLKWYSEMSGSNPEAAKAELQKVVDATIQCVMQLTKYPLHTPKAK